MIGTDGRNDGQVADLVFVVEGTANMGAYLGELRANYIVPTLEYFNGGPATEDKDYGSELNSTMYALVVFMAADIAPESAVSCVASPTTCINKFLVWLDRVPFLGGAAEGCSHIAEGLGAALQAFDDFQTLREPHLNTQKHCILICNSPPYPLPCLESVNYAGMMCEQLASVMGERNINLSVISPRKIPALLKIYDKSSGDLQLAQNKNYTKDRRHLVLLKGYHLQERPLSPTSVDSKDKHPISSGSLPLDKPMLSTSNLMSVGSPVSNPLMQTIPKGGKRKTTSPPNQPPYKQLAATNGNMGPIGIGIHSQQTQGSQQQTQMTTTTNSIISPNMSNIQNNVPPHMPIVNAVRPMGPSGMPINRLPPPQSSQSFMNQPNPPNITITKGPPLPVINSSPVDTSRGIPINQNSGPGPPGQRMVWNPPGRPSGPIGNSATVNLPNPTMSPLVARLSQPTRGSPGPMTGTRPPGPDMILSMTRAPNVTAGNANAMNTPGQGNLVGMLQQGNIGQSGPNHLNQTSGLQPNMMHVPPKGMNPQMNMVPPGGVMSTPSNLQNQIGGQQSGVSQMQQLGNNTSIMNSQPPSGVQLGNQPTQVMTPSNQLPVQQNMIGGVVPTSMPGPMGQISSMGQVSGQGPMGQVPNQAMQAQSNNPPSQMQQQQQQQQLPQQQKEKRIVWQGIIEWQEKPKIPNDSTGKVNRQVPCQVSSTLTAGGEPEVNADKWPKKLIMQLIPKVLMHQFGNTFLKMSRNVIFHFSKNVDSSEALSSLNKVMLTGFVGCVHFSSQQNMNCDLRILMLVYNSDLYTYVGFIPNDQTGFVATIRNVITKKQQTAKQQQQQQGGVMSQQAQQQLFGVQGGPANQPLNPGMGSGMNLPIPGPPGGAPSSIGGPGNVPVHSGPLSSNPVVSGSNNMLSAPVTGPSGGVAIGPNVSSGPGRSSPNPQMQTPGMIVAHPVSGNMNSAANAGYNGQDGRPPNSGTQQPSGIGNNQHPGNLDHIASERQQNLMKIEQLRQSLLAAQQKELQFKSAQEQQQQVQHHVPTTLRQNEVLLLQQLQQQQPRLLGNNASNTNNPQLRQLLQLSHQLMLSQQGSGQRPGVAEMGQGPGSGQPPSTNPGSSIFPDDIM